jgi:beta-phosphoglucomutase-like phosphatase (HAD superfamily)
MNYAFLFDLDGVLVDSKEIHFTSLNLALAEIVGYESNSHVVELVKILRNKIDLKWKTQD